MTEKTYTVTLKEKTNWDTRYSNSDVDFYVGSTIIASDLDHAGVRSGDVVRQVTHDFDFTQNVILKMNGTSTTTDGSGVPGELLVTLSPQGGTSYNVSCKWAENITGSDEDYFNENVNATGAFSINGVVKSSKTTVVGDNDFGTHAITWNGTDTLTFLMNLDQQDLIDSTIAHTTDVELKIS
tara:strand:- start:500 stop:1045 length:546 start_codon:yes stop_codon:yes gene_type:complete